MGFHLMVKHYTLQRMNSEKMRAERGTDRSIDFLPLTAILHACLKTVCRSRNF